ncbi:S41 family peptidase [Shewanella sedimentimangrovi]|uniref:S41 family peptidase n=1 Tax=Shewanella sedimentimangrovi TaxID=2814293 RepID=A0ABX7R3C1_9GAMM|nr:S41 family peptidase [Shewanella sedimentimangrovi]QSX37325.1 S41 family peptidase [Shewanella sedimentimangrovi]
MSQLLRYLGALVLGLTLGLSISLTGQEHVKSFGSQYNYPLLLDIMDTVETYYVNQVDRDELIQAAIKGIFDHLDPYSGYLDRQQLINLRDANHGEYYGFGFEVASGNSEQLNIIAPFPNSPAARAGILAGDRILKINDKLVSSLDLNVALSEIRYHSINNLALDLELQHNNDDQVFAVTLTPETIQVKSVEGKWLSGSIGYIRLSSFQDNTAEDMMAQLRQWRGQAMNGLVLDLRNNPGGLLDQAIKIADLFLAKGRIVSTEGRFFDANSDYFASPQTMVGNIPIMVLINKGSASAAEVLAAALQDNGRATLIGETSFGKGTVQSLIPTLGTDSAIKLTIARYNTPNGRDIHAKGIEPDISISGQPGPLISINNKETEVDLGLDSAIALITNHK